MSAPKSPAGFSLDDTITDESRIRLTTGYVAFLEADYFSVMKDYEGGEATMAERTAALDALIAARAELHRCYEAAGYVFVNGEWVQSATD